MSITFRPADIADLAAIVELGREAFKKDRLPEQSWSRDEVKGFLEAPNPASIVAEVDGKVVGFALGRIGPNRVGEIGWVAIAPTRTLAAGRFIGTSVGQQLAERASDKMIRCHAETVFAEIDPDDKRAAQHLAVLGFSFEATRKIMALRPKRKEANSPS